MLMYAPGEVFGQKDVWLWFDKSLVSIDNPQINYLTAHTNDKFYLILMNESRKIQKLNFCFNAGKISKGKEKFDITKTITANNATLALSGNLGTIEIPPRGF